MRSIVRLRAESLGGAGIAALLVAAGSVSLDRAGGAATLAWSAGALLVVAIEWALLWTHLQTNRAKDGALHPNLGAANRITLARGVLIAGVGGFALAGRAALPAGAAAWIAWLPALLYCTAILLDYVDGLVARLTRRTTRLGELLENEIDSLGVLCAAVCAARFGALPWWFVTVGAARYLFLSGIALRRRIGAPTRRLRHTVSGKVIAGLMMGFLGASLWPIIATGYLRVVGPIFFVPFAAGFLRDWCAVAGWISLDSERAQALGRAFALVVLRILPVPLRLLLAAGAITLPLLPPGPGRVVLACAAALMFAGLAGRLAALGAVAAIVLSAGDATVERLGYVAASTLLLVCGTGALSLLKPEERLFVRRPAAARARGVATTPVSGPADIRGFFDRIAADYTEQHGRAARLLRYRTALLARLLELSGRERLAEIACGTGEHLMALAQSSSEARGVDFSPEMTRRATRLASARALGERVSFAVDDATALLTFADASIDAAFCVGALEHIPDKAALFRSVRRILAPGGRFVCLTVNGGYLWHRLAPRFEISTRHLSSDRFVRSAELIALARAAGFRQIEVGTWSFVPRGDMPPAAARLFVALDLAGRAAHLGLLRGGLWVRCRAEKNT